MAVCFKSSITCLICAVLIVRCCPSCHCFHFKLLNKIPKILCCIFMTGCCYVTYKIVVFCMRIMCISCCSCFVFVLGACLQSDTIQYWVHYSLFWGRNDWGDCYSHILTVIVTYMYLHFRTKVWYQVVSFLWLSILYWHISRASTTCIVR